ncbi:MAG: hypothetical protein A2Z21_01360 [Candidatus Fraserbacteria bacterium RBG_16_55_9]|uniref:Zinc metallopeptidase n=1 Tax=Fraserbacteria sp. (strain RBG_16_55_9) TaxID=1817864 RepID=A0A1F5URA6_FRAXR|nr:MAG: hypothetical protein A2Z21_01360 [Candidatus Fraserbacteria bacterium RBG_16_55_9]
MFFDMRWLIMVAPAILLAIYAQWKVKSSYARYSKIASSSGLTARQVAERILGHGSVSLGQPELRSVRIAAVPGTLTDHYDPRDKTLKLSNPDSRSLADIGVAAHEAGHALQDAAKYQPLMLRSTLVPIAQFGSQLAFPLLLGGFLLKIPNLILLAIIAYAAAVLFTVVTLPVEFNASRRAMKLLRETGVVTQDKELAAVGGTLNAAALTYVAAAATAVLNLLYYITLFTQSRR